MDDHMVASLAMVYLAKLVRCDSTILRKMSLFWWASLAFPPCRSEAYIFLLVVQKPVYFAALGREYLESCKRLLRFRADDMKSSLSVVSTEAE